MNRIRNDPGWTQSYLMTALALTGTNSVDMGPHMKTTVDIADDIFLRAKAAAHAQKTTLRHLIEEGLRQILDRQQTSGSTTVHWITFRGDGLQPEFRDKGWDSIRDTIYSREPDS